MKQIEIINAYKTLEELAANANLTKFEQWGLFKIRKMLKPHIDFQMEQENRVRESFREYADAEGNLHDADADRFVEEMKSIGEMEIEMEEYERPKVKMTDGITFKIIEPLEAFVEFLPPEDDA